MPVADADVKTNSAASYGLQNGGTGGVIWVTVGVLIGALAMVASIAEMASMFATDSPLNINSR